MATPHHGALVEAAIRKSGYSLTKLAAELGMSRSTLYRRFEAPLWSETLLLKTRALLPYALQDEACLPAQAQAPAPLLRSYLTFVGLRAREATSQELALFEKAALQFFAQKKKKLSCRLYPPS